MKRHQEKKHAKNRMGLNDEEPEEVDDGGDVGDCGASDGECEKAGQDSSDSFEDLPEVRRVQLLINEMWPRREVMGAFELRRFISLVIYIFSPPLFHNHIRNFTFTGSVLSSTRSLFSFSSPTRKDGLSSHRQHL